MSSLESIQRAVVDRTGPCFDDLWFEGKTALRQGRIEEARGFFDTALEFARREGDPVHEDRAVCSRAAVRIVLGETMEVVPELRDVLNHHSNAENSRLAAYSLSLAYEQKRDFKKGIFYARVALNYSRLLQRKKWILSSLNQLGNCLMGESFFDEATACYNEALEIVGEETSFHRWAILENLGYAKVLLGKPREGLGMLLRSLRGLLREQAATENAMVAHTDLSYAYLEVGRPRYAMKHAMAGMEAAERLGYPDVKRNAMYLLGQSYQEFGRSGDAAGVFEALQREFFPDSPAVAQFLMAVDVKSMINLRA
jgi:tetratricopeptide (TPR) repeat protein